MADFSGINQEINEQINTNGQRAITGAKLNEVLRDMIAAVNAEKQDPLTIDATPTEDSTNPVESGGVYDALGNLYNAFAVAKNCLFGGYVEPNDEPIYGDDHRYYYLAATEGRYTNFYNFVVDGYIAMFSWNESTQNWRMLSLWPNEQTISRWLQSKANIVYNATDGNLAALDEYGDLSDSGIASSEVATQSDISGFITNTVNNLTNYYLKSETYTQAEVNALIGAIQQFHYEIYATLPQTGQSNVLYLIGPTGSGSDRYEEYVYSNNAFVKIGDTSIDLSGYVTTSALNTALSAYTTTSDLTTLLAGKLNAPATAGTSGQVLTSDGQGGQSWQTPQSGGVTDVTVGGTSVVSGGVAAVPSIPTVPTISTNIASDATSDTKTTSPKAVKTFVEGKGYGTYSKPQGGIPESDLSSDVQQALQKHFKGWYDSSSNLPSNPVVGDYAYVKGATASDPAAIYECTTAGSWSDSGRTADTSNVQTFASGEEVNEVHIVKDLTTGGAEDVLSAEQGKILGTKTDILFNEFVDEVTLQSKFQIIEGETHLSGKGYYGCKNLLKIADVEETITNGITWSVTDGVISLNGTNNSGGYVTLNIPVLQNIEFGAGDQLLYLAFLSKTGSATGSITNVFYMDAQNAHVFTSNPAVPKAHYYYGFTSKEVTVHSTRTTVKGMYIQIANGVGVTNVTIAPTLSFAADKTAFGDSFVKGTGFTAFDGAVDDDFEEGTFVQGNSPITISKYYIRGKGNDVYNKEIDMYIGSVVDGIPHASNGTIEASNEYVTMDSLVTVPSNNARLRFIIPYEINVYIRYGTYGNSVNQTKSLIKNGDIVQLGYDNIVFRLFFSGDTCENIQTMIDNKEIRVLYEDDDVSVCHHDKDALVKSVMYKYTPTRASNGWPTNIIPNLPTFAHVSDLHGDATRLKRCLEYCRGIKGITAIFNSGDTCNYSGVNGLTFVKNLRDSILQDTVLLNCMGNHEAYSLQSPQDQYNGLMKYDIEEYEPETPDGVTYPTYYYIDFSDENIRVIVVNQYCSIDGSYTDTSTGYYSEAELNFVADALYTCPAGYGILIVCHSCETIPSSITGHTKFYTTPSFNRSIVYMWDSTGENHAMPLQDLVDAFISKNDFSKTYTHPSITVGGQTVNATSFTIAKDFSNRQSTAEFIAYINGHSHCDSIGYAQYTTNRQLYLNITCGVAVYGGTSYASFANCCDIPRGGVGATQDAINIYSIDRDKGVVYVVRIGSDKGIGSNGLFVRDIDAIPYK